METTKLYYEDAYLREFDAAVLSCREEQGRYLVVLDRTAFYPEGGGQPADHGVLGGVAVTDVQERDGVVCHTCAGPLAVGSTVHGAIDWQRRFDHMQQHSGEHILSGLLCSLYHCDNVGFHLGADTVTIDYNAELTWEQVMAAEKAANEVIWQDTPVDITFPAPDALARLNYRSKKALTGQVRIVAFPGADCCACCGTHVRRAGEVGIIKVLSCQKFREGVRLEILCGSRAYRYLSQVYDQDRAVAQLLSVKPQDTLAAAKQRMTELEDQLFSLRAQALTDRGDLLLLEPPTRPDGARKLADAAAKASGGLAAVFAGAESSYVYALVQADGADISPLVKRLGGQVIRLSPNSRDYVNPLDINLNYSEEENPLALKSDFVLSFCELIMGSKTGLEAIEKTVIDRAVQKIYQPYFADPRPENMPILSDLMAALTAQHIPEADRVAQALDLYVNGSLNFFNHRTTVDIRNRLVCFDIKGLGKNLKKPGMLIVQDAVWNTVTINRAIGRSTWYFVDEFHLLLKEEQTAAYSAEIWKRFRKWGGVPTGATQNPKDLLSSPEIENILENSDFIYLLNLSAGDRKLMTERLNISAEQLAYVTNADPGSGLLFFQNVILPFRDEFPKDTELYKLLTTKPSEVAHDGKSG